MARKSSLLQDPDDVSMTDNSLYCGKEAGEDTFDFTDLTSSRYARGSAGCLKMAPLSLWPGFFSSSFLLHNGKIVVCFSCYMAKDNITPASAVGADCLLISHSVTHPAATVSAPLTLTRLSNSSRPSLTFYCEVTLKVNLKTTASA